MLDPRASSLPDQFTLNLVVDVGGRGLTVLVGGPSSWSSCLLGPVSQAKLLSKRKSHLTIRWEQEPVAQPFLLSRRWRTSKMPIFECKVSRSVFTDDLKVTRLKENVYVEAKDEIEAKKKAAHPKNWFKSAVTFGKSDRSSFLLTVEECRRVANDELKAIGSTNPGSASAPALFY